MDEQKLLDYYTKALEAIVKTNLDDEPQEIAEAALNGTWVPPLEGNESKSV